MSHPGDAQGYFLLPSMQHTLQVATLQPRGAALCPRGLPYSPYSVPSFRQSIPISTLCTRRTYTSYRKDSASQQRGALCPRDTVRHISKSAKQLISKYSEYRVPYVASANKGQWQRLTHLPL